MSTLADSPAVMREHYLAHGRFRRLAERIAYPGLAIEIEHEKGSRDGRLFHRGHYLRVTCPEGTCNLTGERLRWKGRKWRLSRHMTDMEVVGTAFLAILQALQHEARELFKVDGVAVMDSHRDLDLTLAFMANGGGGNGRSGPDVSHEEAERPTRSPAARALKGPAS